MPKKTKTKKTKKSRSKSPSYKGGREVEEQSKVKIPKSLRKKIDTADVIMKYYLEKQGITVEDIFKDVGMTPHKYFMKYLIPREFKKRKNEDQTYFEFAAEMREKYKEEEDIIADMKKNKFKVVKSEEKE